MNKMDPIDTVIINSQKYALFILLYLILGTALTMYLYWMSREISILFVGFAIFWVCPGVFQKFFRQKFTRKVIIVFSGDSFSIGHLSKETDEIEKKDENRYEEIKSFRALNSSKDDSSFLRVNFRNWNTAKYSFLGQGEGVGQVDITEKVFDGVISYNASHNEADRIVLMPNFFATKAGKYSIIILTTLLIAAIVVQIIFKPQTIPFSLFGGFVLYLLIIAQRKKDVEQLKKMSAGNEQ